MSIAAIVMNVVILLLFVRAFHREGLFTRSKKNRNRTVPMHVVEGNIIGWRAFTVSYGRLLSPIQTHHQFKLIGVNMITYGQPTDHPSVGYYVFRSKRSCVHYFRSGPGRSYVGRGLIYGTVLCHGHVMHHTRKGWFDDSPEGFRCEKVEILALYAPSSRTELWREETAAEIGWPGEIKDVKEGPNVYPLDLKEIISEQVRPQDETPPRDTDA